MDKFALLDKLFTLLEKTIDKELCKLIVWRALEFRPRATEENRRKLDYAITRLIDIKGFRNPLSAPLPILTRELVDVAMKMDIVMEDVLDVWRDSLPKVAEAAKEVLYDRCWWGREDLPDGEDDLRALAELFHSTVDDLAADSGCTRDEIMVMIYLQAIDLLQDQMDDTTEGYAARNEPRTSGPEPEEFLRSVIDALKALPPEAPEWDGTESFVRDLQALAAEKAAERRARSALGEVVVRLLKGCEDDLHFFGMDAGERVPLKEAGELAGKVDALGGNPAGVQESTARAHEEYRRDPPAA